MSVETKEHAKKAGRRLETAGEELRQAAEHAKQSGDKKLVERIVKVSQETSEMAREIKTKTGENG